MDWVGAGGETDWVGAGAGDRPPEIGAARSAFGPFLTRAADP